MQSKTLSIVEVMVNLLGGLLLSIYIVQPLIFGLYGIELELATNVSIAVWFTLVSFIRSYVVRRIFNRIR